MTENIVNIISKYGLETISIAVIVNLLTAIIKTPIKYFANKTKHSTRITRFIVVLPLIIGFAITICYKKLIAEDFFFGKEFVTLWLTSSSLSLTIYAVIEKMIPSKKSVLQDSEAEMTEKIIDKLQSMVDGVLNNEPKPEEEPVEHLSAVEKSNDRQPQVGAGNEQPSIEKIGKIVLRGNSNVQNDVEE